MKARFCQMLGSVAVVATLATTLTACSSGGSGGGASSSSAPIAGDAKFCSGGARTIGYVDIFNASPIETVMSDATKSIATSFGWNFKLVDGAGDFSKMQTGVQNFVAQKVDLIIIASSDAAPLRQGLEAAKAANIPVVEIGGGTTQSDLFTAQYAEDETKLGSTLASYIVEKVPNAKIADLQTSLNYSGKAREEGLRQAVDASGGKAEIVAAQQVDTSNTVGSTSKIMTDMLTAHPDINAVFATFDSMAAAAAASLRQKQSKAQLFTTFASPDNLGLIGKKQLTGVVDANLALTPIVAIDQYLAYATNKTPFDPNAIETAGGLGYRVVTTTDQTFDTTETIAPFLKKWQTEYACK